jgi:hypothetical protein
MSYGAVAKGKIEDHHNVHAVVLSPANQVDDASPYQYSNFVLSKSSLKLSLYFSKGVAFSTNERY